MAGSGLIRRSGNDYAQALAALLPVGGAWPRDPQSDLMKLVSGQAQIWGDVDGRAFDLLETETDPRYADEMLGDWERAFGLPNGCVPAPTTIQGRRDALIAKMTSVGGQSRPFFIGLALSLGYEIEIVEWSPYQGGISRCGDTRPYTGSRKWVRGGAGRCGTQRHLDLPSDLKVTGPYRWRFGRAGNRAWWRVLVKGRTLTWLRAGRGRAGIDRQLKIDPPYQWFRAGAGGGRAGTDRHLRLNRAADLECLFNRYKPAHTVLKFRYGGQPITAY